MMRKRWQFFVLLSLTALAYINIFFNGPAIDDKIFLGKYCPSVVEAFQGVVPKGHEGVYRPMRGVIYSAYCKIWGGNAWGYHLHSLVVHLLATGLVYLIISNFKFQILNLPFITALLFGLHPIHTESITYIAASMEMIGVVFMLGAFWLYLVNARIFSIVLAVVGYFTYEMTLTLPLLLLMYEWVMGKSSQYKKTISYFVTLAFYLVVRIGTIGIAGRAPYLVNSVYLTAITMPKVVVKYLQLMIWPVDLANNHLIAPGIEAFVYRGYRTTAIAAQSILDPEVLFSIMVITFIIAMAIRQRKKYPLFSFGTGWFFISLLPVLYIFPQGTAIAEKYLYLASIGFILLIAVAISKLKVKSKKLKVLIVVVIAVCYGMGTVVRNSEWRDEVTFWGKEVTIYPTDSAYARFSLGDAYYAQKKYPEAIEEYKKSVEINPWFAVGYASLARTYADTNQVELSNLNYQLAEQAEPGFWSRP